MVVELDLEKSVSFINKCKMMRGNDGTGNVVDRDDWETPQLLWDLLNEQYNFTVDCCANENNKKGRFHFKDFKLHIGDVRYTYWMNPPFSKAREMFEHFFKVVSKGVAIYRCDNMETKIWQEVILPNASWVFIPRGRISYEGSKGKGSRFPSAIIGFNVEEPKIHIKGTVLRVKNV